MKKADPMRYIHAVVETAETGVETTNKKSPVRITIRAENGFLRALRGKWSTPHLLEVTVEMRKGSEPAGCTVLQTARQTVLPVELMKGVTFEAPEVPEKIHIRLYQMKN